MFHLSPGILLLILLIGALAGAQTRAFKGWWGRIREAIDERTRPERFVAPTGEKDFDGWVVEGFCAYGSPKDNLAAGVLAGVALPWGIALFAFFYAWINNAFAPAWAREAYGFSRLIHLLAAYGGLLFRSTLIFAALGALFAYARRELVRRRLELQQTHGPALLYALDSRLFAAALGWTLYAAWALWPRGPGGSENFGGALQHPWLWVFFGVIFSGYLHWGHATVLYRLYLWHWERAAEAITRRLLAGQIALQAAGPIEADAKTGSIVVREFPRGRGAARLKDLMWRIPGVRRLSVEEVGEDDSQGAELLTLHVPDEAKGTAVGAMIRAGNLLYGLGVASGFVVYAAGLVYVTMKKTFFDAAGLVVVAALQVELVGWLVGHGLRTLVCRRAQARLPHELARNLAFHGKELKGYRFGGTWREFVVEADLTREEARRILAPVAARFGVERLLVRTAISDELSAGPSLPAAHPLPAGRAFWRRMR